MKTRPLFLTHINIGDSLLMRGQSVLRKITAVREDGVESKTGKRVPTLALFQQEALIVPAKVPPPLLAIIEAQEPKVRERLIAVRWARNTENPHYTLANWRTFEVLESRIETVEVADLTFGGDGWDEGKPEMTDCHTEFHVGVDEIVMPEDFDPRRYL